MEKFDAIVVGAGPAGATAAYLLAKAGMQVIVIERGETAGSKNVSGALLFSHVYSEIFPNFWESAPLERAIVGHAITFLGERTSVNLDYRDLDEGQVPHNAYSVLRARFDPWMAQQAEEAGAMLMTGFTVDKLLQENGRVVGIEAGGDELMADVVVVAEGTRSGLLKEAGLRTDEFKASDVSIGVKEVISLPAEVITNRFQCLNADEGVAYTCVGHTGGVEGGGFLYTNKDTLSLGVVAKIDAVYKSKLQPHAILNEFKAHPFISRLIAGGEIVEYSAQAIHRGGVHLISQLYGDGYVVAGSAARLLLNNVMTLRGMDVAVASAAAAAKAILGARDKGDYSRAALADYEQIFKATNVYKDMVTFKDTYPLLENERLFHVYPELAGAVVGDMFAVGAAPSKKGYRALRDNMRGKVSLWQMMRDMNQIGKGLVR
jgi:electron transfer flavoprotein-quinone oxidoreductase